MHGQELKLVHYGKLYITRIRASYTWQYVKRSILLRFYGISHACANRVPRPFFPSPAKKRPGNAANMQVVSFPRPSRAPARKKVWNLSHGFLALLSRRHVRKTGKPIRTQDSKQSCDFNAYWNTARFQFQLPSVYARSGIGPYAQST